MGLFGFCREMPPKMAWRWVKLLYKVREPLGRNENALPLQIVAAFVTDLLLRVFEHGGGFRGRFDTRKDSRKGVMRRNAVFQFQKGVEPILFGFPEGFHLREVSGVTNCGENRNRNDINQHMIFAAIDSRVRQIGEIF